MALALRYVSIAGQRARLHPSTLAEVLPATSFRPPEVGRADHVDAAPITWMSTCRNTPPMTAWFQSARRKGVAVSPFL